MEQSPEKSEVETEKEYVEKTYQNLFAFLRENGFEPTIAEAVFIRNITKEVLIDEPKERGRRQKETGKNQSLMATTAKGKEVLARFFLHFYGINILEHLNNKQNQLRDTFKYIQEKLRKDRELI